MSMRAVVERNTAAGKDAHGHDVVPVFGVHKTIPCRVWSKSRTEVLDGDKQTVVETIKAIFPLAADITESDQIAKVTSRLGATLFAGPLDIETLARKQNHLAGLLSKP